MLPILPDGHAIAVLGLIVVALYLFTRESIPLETSSLLVLIGLVIGFEAFPYQRDGISLEPTEFFSGFGHEALITICALMIVGKGTESTGALQPLASLLSRMWAASPVISSLLTLVFAAAVSAFLNNTPIVVMLLPILISVSLHSKQSASGILLPMGLATLLGGMATTIGTSTNLLVVSIAADLGLKKMHMFDFALPVLIAGGFGILYLWLVAPRLLPEREPLLSDTSPRIFDAVLHITKDGMANGKTLNEVLEKTGKQMRVASIHRGEGLAVIRLPSATLREGDRLHLSDTPDNLKAFEQALGATLYSAGDTEHPVSEEHPLAAAEDQQLAELVVTEHSTAW
jgi:di/tricarboxylate transporter